MVDLKPNDFEKSVKEIDLGRDTQNETLNSIDKAWYVPPEIIPDAEMASKNEKESSTAIKTTANEFANCTTVHGIVYVFDAAIKVLDRLLWFLICCFGLFLAVYWSYDAWITWKEHPVLTSVSSTGLPLQKIDFPAITICSQGLIQVTRIQEPDCSLSYSGFFHMYDLGVSYTFHFHKKKYGIIRNIFTE